MDYDVRQPDPCGGMAVALWEEMGSCTIGGHRGRGCGLEPDSGKPTVRDHREALGTIGDGGTRNPLHRSKEWRSVTPFLSAVRPVSIPIPHIRQAADTDSNGGL